MKSQAWFVCCCAVVACGGAEPGPVPSPTPSLTKKEVLTSSRLLVRKAYTSFSEDSYAALQGTCAGTVLWLERGTLDVQIGGVHERLESQQAVWAPGSRSLNIIDGEGEYVVATVQDATEQCPMAQQPLTRREAPWHDNAGGKLRVRVFFGGQEAEQMPMSLAELHGEAGFSVPPHIHAQSDENLWIRQGRGIMRVGDEAIEVRGDQWVHVPKGVMHSFESDGSEPLVALQMYVPSGPEQRFIQ